MSSIDAISRTPEWRALSAKQRFWLQTYVESGNDEILATRAAYDVKGDESCRCFGYEILRKKKIQNALRVFRNFGKSERDVFLDDLKTEIAASKPRSLARAKLQEAYAQTLLGTKMQNKRKKGASRK